MSDDIVFRLRNCWCGYCRDGVDGCLKREASDEIQRLREEVAAWKDVAQELTMYAAMQELKEAAGE